MLQESLFVSFIVKNTVEYKIFLEPTVVLQNLCGMIQVEELLSHVLILFLLYVSDTPHSLPLQPSINLRKLTHIILPAQIQIRPSHPRHLSTFLLR
jgi:hypothetical protein